MFATTSTSTQVVVLPWRYDVEMGTPTRYMLRHNMATIIKGLVFNLESEKMFDLGGFGHGFLLKHGFEKLSADKDLITF